LLEYPVACMVPDSKSGEDRVHRPDFGVCV